MSNPTPTYPKLCHLCNRQIESVQDLDWHGYGNCVEITDEMWADWEKETAQSREKGE